MRPNEMNLDFDADVWAEAFDDLLVDITDEVEEDLPPTLRAPTTTQPPVDEAPPTWRGCSLRASGYLALAL